MKKLLLGVAVEGEDAAALGADGGEVVVAGKDRRVVGQRRELLQGSAHVSHGTALEISAPDGAGEQRVTGEEHRKPLGMVAELRDIEQANGTGGAVQLSQYRVKPLAVRWARARYSSVLLGITFLPSSSW